MRLLVFVATIAAVVATDVADKVDGNLRGADTEDRDLASFGGYSESHSFSTAAYVHGHGCFDHYSFCDEWVKGHLETGTYASASGNAYAQAHALIYLWAEANCDAIAKAIALSCAFVHVNGDMKADVTAKDDGKEVSVDVKLKTATLSLSLAATAAAAKAYAKIGAAAYTSVSAYCASVDYKTEICAGGGTALKQIGKASSGSFGKALASSGAGSYTYQKALAYAKGKDVDLVKVFVVTYAMNWAFSQAAAVAAAYAEAFTAIYNKSFTVICIKKHEDKCKKDDYKGKWICSKPPTEACALAYAKGEAYAGAFAKAFAAAYAAAFAKTYVVMAYQAYVYCTDWGTKIGFAKGDVGDAIISSSCPDTYSESDESWD